MTEKHQNTTISGNNDSIIASAIELGDGRTSISKSNLAGNNSGIIGTGVSPSQSKKIRQFIIIQEKGIGQYHTNSRFCIDSDNGLTIMNQ